MCNKNRIIIYVILKIKIKVKIMIIKKGITLLIQKGQNIKLTLMNLYSKVNLIPKIKR